MPRTPKLPMPVQAPTDLTSAGGFPTPEEADGSSLPDRPAESLIPDEAAGYLTPDEAARYLKMAKQTLARWRCEGTGPPYYLFGRYIRYGPPDLKNWEASRRVRATAQKPGI